MQLIGRVLWWDARDQQGIIKDATGRKIYFDISSIDTRSLSKIKSGLVVRFEINNRIKDALSAHKVAAANLKEQTRHEREIEDRRQLPLFT